MPAEETPEPALPGPTSESRDVRHGLATVTRGTVYLLLATLLYVGFNFVARVLVVRTVSTADWSAFSFALTLAALVAGFGTLGLPSAVGRSLPYVATDAERRAIVRTTLWVGGAAGIAASGAVFVAAGPIGSALGSPGITLALQFFPIPVGSAIVSSLLAAIFQGYEDVAPNALFVQTINPGLFLGFLAGLAVAPSLGLGFRNVLLAYAVANAIALGLIVAYTARHLPRRLPAGPVAPRASRELLRFAAPLLVVGAMSTVVGWGDTLVLGVYHATEVGTYAASLTLARLLQIGLGAASYIFLPVAARFVQRREPGSVTTTFTTVTKWMALFSLPPFLVFVIVPSASLGFVYGANYTAIVLPLQVVVVGALLTTLLGPAPTAQIAFGEGRLLAVNAVVAGLTDVGVAVALVPVYGYTGAAVAWASANVVYSALSLGELTYLHRVHPFRRSFVLPVVATAALTGGGLLLVRSSVTEWMLPGIALAIAAAFVGIVLATGSIDEGDRLLLDAIEELVGRPLPWLRRIGRLGVRRRADP